MNPNLQVAAALLAAFQLTDQNSALSASGVLAHALSIGMQRTEVYNLPVDQALPDADIRAEAIAARVHPYNIGCALLSLRHAGVAVQGGLQLFNGQSWQLLDQNPLPAIEVKLAAPPPPPAPAPAPVVAPPPAPAAPAPAPAATPIVDAATLVQQATDPTAARPIIEGTATRVEPITTPEQYAQYREQQGHVAAPAAPVPAAVQAVVAPATTGGTAPVTSPQHVTYAQAVAAAASAPIDEAKGLPDPGVLHERTGKSGRPQKSPFEKKVEKRNKVAAPPFWWESLRYSLPRAFVDHPSQALDPSSDGAGPVQTYAVVIAILGEALRAADGALTVAELRAWLREVETGINGLPDAEAINQLVTHLFGEQA